VRQLIVNAIGPDRPGIVGQLTGHLHVGGANVLDSRMVNLRGQFAVIILLEADEDAAVMLRQTLPEVAGKMGLRLTVTESEPQTPSRPGIPYKVKTYSMDRPGIVHGVSDLLRARGINIEELTARQESAPFSGMPLFLMELRLTVPPEVRINELRGELQALCDSLNCDLDFEPA
jgi:glycine cleavage system transcriptional repressor